MARTLPQHLYQHLKHLYGSSLAKVVHALPDFCLADASVPEHIHPQKTASDSLRGALFSYWQLFGKLERLPQSHTNMNGLIQQLPGLNRSFSLKETLGETGLSYECAATVSENDPDDFAKFMRCCATWFQQDEHGSGSLAWAVLAREWLTHFSRAFPLMAAEALETELFDRDEGAHCVIQRCPRQIDPEFLRTYLSISTQKIAIVATEHDAKTGVFSLHMSREDRLELLEICEGSPPASLLISSTDLSLQGPITQLDEQPLYSEAAAFLAASSQLITDIDDRIERVFQQRPVLTASTADLPAIDKINQALGLEQKKSKYRQIPAQLLLDPDQTYYYSLGSATEIATPLRELLNNPEYQHIELCSLWSGSDRSVSVHLPLRWARDCFQEGDPLCARLVQQSSGRFILRGTATHIGIHLFPQPKGKARRLALSQYQLDYTNAQQYIRDPLSAAQRRDALLSLGDATKLDQDASTALMLWMQSRGVRCHASFESYADPVSGLPFFISMNLYRTSAQGVDCRSVSVFIQSVDGRPVTLSDEAVQMGLISNQELQQTGISAEEADHLLCKALDRATLSQQGELSSQWENATHQARQLMPILPSLMARVARSSPLDSTRLIRELQLSALPTHQMELTVGPSVRASFHDAWRGRSPLTLHGFLADPTSQVLASVCGRFILQKDGEHFVLFDQENLSAHAVLRSADELRTDSLMRAKSFQHRLSPSKTGELLDRYKIAVLMDQSAPALQKAGVFELPAFIPLEHPVHTMRHTLMSTFAEWSLLADFKLPAELLVEQFNALLPPKLSTQLDAPLCGGEGSQVGRIFLTELLQADPRLIESMQYGHSKRDLLQTLSQPGFRLDPADTVFSLRHLIRWNLLRFFEDNPARTAHYQQMPAVLSLLSELEPNTKIAPQEVLQQIAQRFALSPLFVREVYQQAYRFQSADPCQQDFLPSRQIALPLQRELLQRDWTIWAGLYRRAQSVTFFPALEPMLQALGRDQIQTQIQWWIEKELHPAVRLSKRPQTHRHTAAYKIRLQPDILDGHQQYVEISAPHHISDQTLSQHIMPSLNATLSLWRLQNSLGQVHAFERDDLTFTQERRTEVLSSMVHTLGSMDVTRPQLQLEDACQQLQIQAIRVVDDGPLLQLFQGWAQSVLLKTPPPAVRALSAEQGVTLLEQVLKLHHHVRNRPLSETMQMQLNTFVRRCEQVDNISAWAVAQINAQPQRALLTDDTTARNGHWQSIFELTETPFICCTKQQLVGSILSSGPLNCQGLDTADELALEIFVSTGKMPAHGTPAKIAIQQLAKACTHLPLRHVPEVLESLAQSFSLKSVDAPAALRQYQQKYPAIQPSQPTPNSIKVYAQQSPDKPGK